MSDQEVEQITADLVQTMRQCGTAPTPYSIAIRITAEALRERDRAYRDHMKEDESRRHIT